MYPRSFEYVSPGSLDEATSVLASTEGAKVLAGGMSLLPLMKLRLFSPDVLVDIGRIPGLSSIEDRGDHLAIGAMVSHAATASDPSIAEHAAALATAASWTGDVQVRNQGTTCGSIAHADIAADQPSAALALGATMVAASAGGVREIAASDFFVDTLTTALEPGEILTETRIPKQGGASAYEKLGRRGGHTDYAVAGAAVWLDVADGAVSSARVALTGVGAKPTLAEGVVEALVGTDGSGAAIAEASERALEGVTVLDDLFGTVEYKAHLAKVMTRRALQQAVAAAT
ncbi:MAG: xanthine dehydrogenase family protein subunit M [Acidimicrobiia bacterium]|nr:xanthine dehydrogenase family protein subunit M [bacterium]MDE0674825.1 xanthine dehydrogenase family protein subunit M [bacterium]MXX01677.1 xanthine dehydrogenase family protein subunit M [Acidimicrobiia bacterium]MYB77995.1 xanthine dehydrogenase family protein subunit M [Acidimicrobiia bacterium]MYG92128.1 xanthine dehydrogenase family protein subunit M [Acidimicrobiia bacterium]